MNGPSPHLAWSELACHDGTPYPAVWRESRALALGAMFEAIRERVGKPLRILSAYRTPEHNRRVGGARHSQHVEGRALDLKPPQGWTVARLAETCAVVSAVTGLGVYPTFVHVDCRPGRRVVWRGGRLDADKV